MNDSKRLAMAFVVALTLVVLSGVPALAQGYGSGGNTCNLPQCDDCTFPLPVDWKPPKGCWCYPPCPFAGTPDRGLPPGICFPYPQARPAGSAQTTETRDDGSLHTRVVTGQGLWPACDPFDQTTFPGNNFLPTVYTNLFDAMGREMANTLPSTPDVPYNLHGDPAVTVINPTSPADDLKEIFDDLIRESGTIVGYRDRLAYLGAVVRFLGGRDEMAESLGEAEAARLAALGPEEAGSAAADAEAEIEYLAGQLEFLIGEIPPRIQMGLDIFEGNPIENRAYSGFAALHYDAANRVGVVEPVYDAAGKVVGGNVDVHQIWFGGRIEADTAFLDVSKIIAPCAEKDANGDCPDSGTGVPWTITYTVDVLNRGDDDFSPFVTYWDGDFRSESSKPHVGMDQSFFNMDAGTRTVFVVKMTPGKYLNLVYTWGWRLHPPRVQVMENALKRVKFDGDPSHNVGCDPSYAGMTLVEVEQAVFGDDPRADKEAAIARIGDLAPAKRMYDALLEARRHADEQNYELLAAVIRDRAQPAYFAWLDRIHLPCYDLEPSPDGRCRDGFDHDPEADVTIVYANNTIYGDFTSGRPTTRGAWARWEEWEQRPQTLKVTAYNADRFVHAYTIADFGGSRGWENQFKSSVRVAGSGCWFTFGRANWWMAAGSPKSGQNLCVPAADGDKPGKHTFEVTFNFEPSRRLRFYQFDPWHHDLAVWSVH